MKKLGMLLLLAIMILIINCGRSSDTTKAKPEGIAGALKSTQETLKGEGKEEKETLVFKEESSEVEVLTKTASQFGKYVVIYVRHGEDQLGKIKIGLYTKEAPKTCENFIKLVKKGFYNGLTFHRVIKGFVVQGGDPKGDGTGGPGYTIPAEISPNLKHIRGAVACARLPDHVNPTKASSGSQFYICHQPAPHLDGNYTIFGQVVEGLEVVDKIAQVRTGLNDRPVVPIIMEKVVVEE
jgi:cyclophilin family peptidyl-prolyl cis-trans isomerase